MKGIQKFAFSLLVFSLGISILHFNVEGSAADSVGLANCNERKVVDYLRPFDRMPAVHPPPSSGRLAFAPPDVLLPPPSFTLRRVGETFGYGLSINERYKEFSRPWIVKTQLIRVDRKGRDVKTVAKQRHNLEVVRGFHDLDFTLPLTDGRGFFRYEISFTRPNGHVLGAFSQYTRVVYPRIQAFLRLGAKQYSPGGVAQVQLVNPGTVILSFGYGVSVEMFTGYGWVPSSIVPSEAPRRPEGFVVLDSGGASKCETLSISPAASPGLYRVKTQIWPRAARNPRTLTAEFQIVG